MSRTWRDADGPRTWRRRAHASYGPGAAGRNRETGPGRTIGMTMYPAVDITRRTFLVHAGRGTIALAVLTVAGCTPAATASPSAAASASASDGGSERRAVVRGTTGVGERPAVERGRRRHVASSQPRLRLGLHPRAGWRGGHRRHRRQRQRGADRDRADRRRSRLGCRRARDPDPSSRRSCGQHRRGARGGPRRHGLRRRRGHLRHHLAAAADGGRRRRPRVRPAHRDDARPHRGPHRRARRGRRRPRRRGRA